MRFYSLAHASDYLIRLLYSGFLNSPHPLVTLLIEVRLQRARDCNVMALWSNLQRLLVCLFFFVLYTFTMKFLKLESQSQEPLMILPTIIGRSQDNSEYSSSHNDGFITITEIPFESGSAAAVPLLQWIGGDHVHVSQAYYFS